jgi:hypothetical protein
MEVKFWTLQPTWVIIYMSRAHFLPTRQLVFMIWRDRFMLVWNYSLAISISPFLHGSTLPHQVRMGFFYSLFEVISKEIWGIVKTTTPHKIPGYKTLELVVESEQIFSSYHYDPTSILESSNPVLAEKRTHSWAQSSSRIPVQNMDEDEEEEEWHLDVVEDDI